MKPEWFLIKITTNYLWNLRYHSFMKLKCIDEQHENDLTMVINEFIKDKKVIDIKFSNACFKNNDEQIYCFSALILYEE